MHDDPSSLQRRALPVGRQIRLLIVLAAATAVVVLFCFSLGGNSAVSANSSGIELAADQVRLNATQLATLGIAAVQTATFHDTVVADAQIAVNADTTTQVYSPYSGRVVRVLAGVGDRVRAGAPLVTLDAGEALDTRSALVTARAQARMARLTEARRHAAYDSHGGSLQDWQQAQSELTAAEAALAAARGRLRVLGSSEAQIRDLEEAGVVTPLTSIPAPLAGLVTDRQVGPGQVIQAGSSTPLFTVADLSSVWLLGAVRDDDAAGISPGQPIVLHVPALPGHDYHATVQSVGAQVDPATHRVMVRATVSNGDGRLRPAMQATAEISTSPDSSSPGVPEGAIVREGEQAHVWVVRADGVLERRAIHTGRRSGSLTEVRTGLRVGERIVTSGSVFIDSAAQPD
jgi:membrane fusion protein, heavy metal efflux system